MILTFINIDKERTILLTKIASLEAQNKELNERLKYI